MEARRWNPFAIRGCRGSRFHNLRKVGVPFQSGTNGFCNPFVAQRILARIKLCANYLILLAGEQGLKP